MEGHHPVTAQLVPAAGVMGPGDAAGLIDDPLIDAGHRSHPHQGIVGDHREGLVVMIAAVLGVQRVELVAGGDIAAREGSISVTGQ